MFWQLNAHLVELVDQILHLQDKLLLIHNAQLLHVFFVILRNVNQPHPLLVFWLLLLFAAILCVFDAHSEDFVAAASVLIDVLINPVNYLTSKPPLLNFFLK